MGAPKSAHNPACAHAIPGYALFERPDSLPLPGARVEALLVGRGGEFRCEPCAGVHHGQWICHALPECRKWRVVGWRYPDSPAEPPHAIDVTRVDLRLFPSPSNEASPTQR